MNNKHDLLIRCRLFYYATDQSDARLVVSIENKEEAVFWKALELDRYVKAYSNWWPVHVDVTLAHKDLQANSRLKVYVWKKSPAAVCIDNFRIEISEISPE
jgi:hypothetical protein